MADFSVALAYILPNEGGYSRIAADKGGATNYGITQGVLDSWNAAGGGFPPDVADLTEDQAGAIYQANYWPEGMEQISSDAVGAKMLDIMVNFGVGGGLKIIQAAANTLVDPPTAVDGGLGPDTIATINAADPELMLGALVSALKARYSAIVAKDPGQSVFLNGWLARAARTPALIAGGLGLVVLLFVGGLIWMNNKGRGL